MKILKYMTGDCPVCGSRLTARLRQGRDGKMSFCFGSPVVYTHDAAGYNCTCASCGVRWSGFPKLRLVPMEEVSSLREEWNGREEAPLPESADEQEILEELSEKIGYVPDWKKKKKKSRIAHAAGWILKEAAHTPADSARSLFEDISGSVSGSRGMDKRTEEDEKQ